MMAPIGPQSVYIIHKEKEHELERQIEMNRNAREQRAYSMDGSSEEKRPWYAEAAQWISVRLFNRPFASKLIRSKTFAEPCTGVPC